MEFGAGTQIAWIFALFFLHLLIPGPNMLYLCASASRGGRAEAIRFSFGIALADSLWAALVAFGLWHLLDQSVWLAGLFKAVMGLTLIVLGASAIFSALKMDQAEPRIGGNAGAFAKGVLVSLSNANQIVFWGTVLAIGTGVQFTTAGATAFVLAIGLIALAFFIGLAFLASGGVIGRLVNRLRTVLELGLGGAFCATGAGLLLPQLI